MNGKKRTIYLLYAIACLQGMVFYGSIATLYRQSQHLTVFDITLIESLSLTLMILLEVPWGYIADNIGYRRTMILCNALYFASKIVFWQANGFGMFLAERLMLSVVLSGLSGCDSAYLYQAAERKNTQKVFGTYHAMGFWGLIAASVTYSLFVGEHLRLAALLTVYTYGAAMVLSLFLAEFHNDPKEKQPFAREILCIVKMLRNDTSFALFLLASALLTETHQTLTVFLNQIQYVRSGLNARMIGIIFVGVTLVGVLSSHAHRLTARLGERRSADLLYGTAALSCLLLTFTSLWYLSVLGILALRVSASLFVPIGMDIQNRRISDANRATVLSVYSMAMNTVGIGTNLVLGKAADLGVQYAMAIGAVFCLTGWVLFRIWHIQTQQITTQ